MDRFSTNLRKKILDSYLKNSKKVIRLTKTEETPNSHLSYAEFHAFEHTVWFLSSPFYVINNGIKFEIPSGFCVSFDAELSFLSRVLLGKKYARPILVLVWFRDVLKYDLVNLKRVVECTLIDEGFGNLSRMLLMLSLRLK